MAGKALAADVKRTSALRRVPPLVRPRYIEAPGQEGGVCAFQLLHNSSPILVEAVGGRAMALVPGDIFLATAGHRESTRWAVGAIPKHGLRPRQNYWVLCESGAVGNLAGATPIANSHLGRVRYLGAVCEGKGQPLNIRDFAVHTNEVKDRRAPVYLFVGTSAEVGKSTALLTVLSMLRTKGHSPLVALKATGTSSYNEIAKYRDYGAAYAFDCVDFGVPTTYPSNRRSMTAIFDRALDICLGIRADAVLIECGGDILGANVPAFLKRLKRRRERPKVVLAASDALGALSAVRMIEKIGLSVTMIVGPCTDSPTLRKRTKELCGIEAVNMEGR